MRTCQSADSFYLLLLYYIAPRKSTRRRRNRFVASVIAQAGATIRQRSGKCQVRLNDNHRPPSAISCRRVTDARSRGLGAGARSQALDHGRWGADARSQTLDRRRWGAGTGAQTLDRRRWVTGTESRGLGRRSHCNFSLLPVYYKERPGPSRAVKKG